MIIQRALPTVALVLLVGAPQTQAQDDDTPEGRRIVFDISERIESVRNPDLEEDEDDETRNAAITNLNFQASSRTRTQSIVGNFSTSLRILDDDDPDLGERRATLSYGRRGVGSNLNARFNYRRDEITFLEPLDLIVNDDGEIEVPDDIEEIDGEGIRERLIYSVGASVGQAGPVAFSFRAEGDELRYSDVTDPDLEDESETILSTEVRFALNGGRALTAGATYRLQEEDDEEDSETRNLRLGFTADRAPLQFSFNVNTTQTEDGERLGASAGLDRDLGNGDSAGVRIGAERSDDGDTFFEGSANYTRKLPLGSINARVGRGIVDDGDDGEFLVTQGQLSWNRDLSSVSDLSVRASVVEREGLDVDDEDRRTLALNANYSRAISDLTSFSVGTSYAESIDLDEDESVTIARVSASLRRELTNNWNARVGVAVRLRDDENDDTRTTSESVFFTIGRTFDGIF